jgi:beta-lactamase class A
MVAFAVLEPSGRLRGLRRTERFRSASVTKAMLLVAVLRRAKDRKLAPVERALLGPMVTASDNRAADTVFAQVGDAGLEAVARAAGMRRFGRAGTWSQAELTPADQARLFLRLDKVVPARHRRYARGLLSGIVPWQRWGIPEVVARRPGARAYFKGGWRRGLTHQVALVERGPRRIALAVMTSGEPDMPYDEDTIAGIARRVLLR